MLLATSRNRALLILAFLLPSILAFSQPGANDPTFNTSDNGYGNGDGPYNLVFATAIQPDGKILLGGSFGLYNSRPTGSIARLDTNGLLDKSFHTDSGVNYSVLDLAIQPDGKVVVVGGYIFYNPGITRRMARLNNDGSLDTTFQTGIGANGDINTVSIQTNGKILIAGKFSQINGFSTPKIARLNSNGTIDTTFNIGTGLSLAGDIINTLHIQADGKILVGGNFNSFNGTSCGGIIRLDSTGTVDTSFSLGTGASGSVNTISVQSNGEIIAGGSFYSFNGKYISSLVRLSSAGLLDTAFQVLFTQYAKIYTTAIQTDGKILIGGEFYSSLNSEEKMVLRLDTTGSIDSLFQPTQNTNDYPVNSISIQNNGKILVGGHSGNYRAALSRFSLNGKLDQTFNPRTGISGKAHTISIQNDQKIIVGGTFYYYNGTVRNCIARLHSNGLLDTSFNPGAGAFGIYASAIQQDGKILIGGSFPSYDGIPVKSIARINSDGSLDSSFNIGFGFGYSVGSTQGWVLDIKTQPDGKILVAGLFDRYNCSTPPLCSPNHQIIRLNQDGSADTTFTSALSLGGQTNSISLQSNGKIVAGGTFSSVNGVSHQHLTRLNSDGTVDLTFNPSSTGPSYIVETTTIQPDGKIVAGGYFNSYNGKTSNYIVRLDTNGVLDTSFKPMNNIKVRATSISCQPDGRLIVASRDLLGDHEIICLKSDGSFDSTFTNGHALKHFTTNDGYINCMRLQSDGKILVGGNFTNYGGVGKNRITRLLDCHPTIIKDSITSCKSYTWIDGITYTSSNDSSTVSYLKSNGCDSIVELYLTINRDSSNQSVSACKTYTSPSGKYTWTTSGMYRDTLQTVTGCDSLVFINLSVENIDTSITLSNAIISSNHIGASYQWLDCHNGFSPISGETNQIFIPKRNGLYAVEITSNGCIDTTTCSAVNDVSLSDFSIFQASIYPNPADGIIHIAVPSPKHYSITVYDIAGNTVLSKHNVHGNYELDLSKQASGLYNIHLNNDTQTYSRVIRLQ